jgi:hypothetical protein
MSERSAAADAALELLHMLGSGPRAVGTHAEYRARSLCADRLRDVGFETRERPFEYSAFTGRWATPLAGIIAFFTLPSCAILAHHHGRVGHSLVALLVIAALLALAGRWLARDGVLELPFLRARAVNLEARPRSPSGSVSEPRVWLVAHVDSKSQPIPMALRAAGITVAAAVWVGLVLLAILSMVGIDVVEWWIPAGALGAVSSIPIVASTVGNKSPGALDNASGVASVLLAAASVSPELPIGVLLTTAEELGLAGARAWVRDATGRVPVVNCDGVDDVGELVLMYTGRRPDRLIAAATRARSHGAAHVAARRLPSGILVDAVAFADAGWETLTVSRGTWRTFARIHRPSDDLAHLRGEGVEQAALLLATLATELVKEETSEGA